jgi:DNA-binding response OmpR family regulator
MRRGASLLKVLIAEDELLIADQIEETLVANGYEVCGIARTADEGIALGELHKPDLALLDLRLAKGSLGTDIARRLNSAANLGVLYATGNNPKSNPLTITDGDAVIAKPFRAEDLLRALAIVWEITRDGRATPPYPRNFRLLARAPARHDRGAST